MKRLLAQHWFFIALAVVALVAFYCPAISTRVKDWNLVNIAIFIGFLVTGLTLATGSIAHQIKNIRALVAAVFSCFVLFPAVAYCLAHIAFADSPDFRVGLCIMAVAPVTIASGTIMTGLAGGNIPLSLLICVTCNLVAVFTVPISLQLLLQSDVAIDLPVLQMIRSLAMVALLPAVLGQVLRIWFKERIALWQPVFSVFSRLVVLLIIFNALASSAGKITQLGWPIVLVFVLMVVLHGLIVLANLGIARLLRLDRPSTSAFTIHTSQKTLTITYLVWSVYFAGFPLGLIPATVHHLIQVVFDMFVARRFARAASADGSVTTA